MLLNSCFWALRTGACGSAKNVHQLSRAPSPAPSSAPSPREHCWDRCVGERGHLRRPSSCKREEKPNRFWSQWPQPRLNNYTIGYSSFFRLCQDGWRPVDYLSRCLTGFKSGRYIGTDDVWADFIQGFAFALSYLRVSALISRLDSGCKLFSAWIHPFILKTPKHLQLKLYKQSYSGLWRHLSEAKCSSANRTMWTQDTKHSQQIKY